MSFLNPRDFLFEGAALNVPGVETGFIFGQNRNVTAGITVGMWELDSLFPWPVAAQTLGVVSTSTDDDGSPAGIGAHKILISGLDASYLEISEEVTLNGTSEVITTAAFLRVNTVDISEAGSTEANVGDITIDQTTSGDVLAFMLAAQGRAHMFKYTVPNNKELYVSNLQGSILGKKSTDILTIQLHLRTGSQPNITNILAFEFDIIAANAVTNVLPSTPLRIAPKMDIYLNLSSNANRMEGGASMSFLQRDA